MMVVVVLEHRHHSEPNMFVMTFVMKHIQAHSFISLPMCWMNASQRRRLCVIVCDCVCWKQNITINAKVNRLRKCVILVWPYLIDLLFVFECVLARARSCECIRCQIVISAVCVHAYFNSEWNEMKRLAVGSDSQNLNGHSCWNAHNLIMNSGPMVFIAHIEP